MAVFSTALCAEARAPRVHVVRPGETLSTIALRRVGRPVYRKNGSLDLLARLNPGIRDLDAIRVADRIVLPSNQEPRREQASAEGPETSEAGEEREASPLTSPARSGSLEFEPLLEFSKIESVDHVNGSRALLLSDPHFGAAFRMNQDWSDRWESAIGVGFRTYRYETTSSKAIDNASGTLAFGGATLRRRLGERASLGLSLRFDQTVFVRGLTTQRLAIDRVVLPSLGLLFRYAVLQTGRNTLSLGAGSRVIAPQDSGTYAIKTGLAHLGELESTQSLSSSLALAARVFYEVGSQNTSISDQKRTELGFGFGLRWSLGGSQ